ncbi:hypothetical protein BP5796_10186 [Coleophoma crateriformis]|uniref:FAD-binding PCMH-type domain-containing protein n=1 Tax=Coleophoma crateriformis TaxID=565419 RepID=A0A3D8QVF3_9HELO|nr:hypothetical protein BP5796_10186 [Coleophoma crateriformis]
MATLITAGLLLLQSISTNALPFDTQLNARQTSLVDCLEAGNVPLTISTYSNYTEYQESYNLRVSYQPAVITLPVTTDHVSLSVTCAAAAGVKVQAKSGGHSYGSYSSGGQDGSLIVDLENFNTVSLDNSTFIATVGGGVRLGNLALGIYNQGNRALPHGTCPGVGIGGHFLHGGYGHGSRHWGLALDTIVGLDVVLANGTFVHASATEYPDIYFAMRGAGDSFGIATTFYLQTEVAPAQLVNFLIDVSAVLDSVDTVTTAFMTLQNWVLTSSLVNGNLSFGLYTDGTSLTITGWYFGDLSYFQSTIQPALLQDFPTPNSADVTAKDWLDSLLFIEGGSPPGPLAQPLTGYSAHDTFYAKSLVTKNAEPLTQAAVQSFFDYVINTGRSQSESWFTIINLYGGLGSQINQPSNSSSAYSDRDSLWVFQNYGTSGTAAYTQGITEFVTGLNTAITDVQTDGDFSAYLNYLDPMLSKQDAQDLYYGADLAAQLLTIKNQVDPDCVFWNPQSICAN